WLPPNSPHFRKASFSACSRSAPAAQPRGPHEPAVANAAQFPETGTTMRQALSPFLPHAPRILGRAASASSKPAAPSTRWHLPTASPPIVSGLNAAVPGSACVPDKAESRRRAVSTAHFAEVYLVSG